MSTAAPVAWAERNQQHLVREFIGLRRRLGDEVVPDSEPHDIDPLTPPPAIDVIAQRFSLSTFERELLLLCAGVEMDSALASRCADVSGRSARHAVTFSLALAVLTDPHWSALAPFAPLRRFRLIEMEPGQGVTLAPLSIDERVMHYLAGVNGIDERLAPVLRRKPDPRWVAQEHWTLVTDAIPPAFSDGTATAVLHLCGDDAAGQESIAAVLAGRAGRELYVLRLEDTPATSAEIDQFVHLWTRESMLLPAWLLLQWGSDTPGAAARQLAERLAEGLAEGPPAPLMIASRDSVRLSRGIEQYEVNTPCPATQRRIWEEALGPVAGRVNGVLDELAQQFRLSAETIVSIGASFAPGRESADAPAVRERLWNACRSLSRPRLDGLAERIVPASGWDDLVLPEMQKTTLRQLAAQSRHRMTVYEAWGFAAKGRRGLGLSALFSGPSGTGKTLAAEVLAAELGLDLYRIDLASVVSKYIGETEKNLKRVFDAAETGGVLLLFDEADALFGKRAEVKDSHDRYANIEVGYLLQRMESFQGLAILTTNLKSSLDKSFQRRLRFLIDFPFPDAVQREAIWSRVFPARTPTRDLRPALLARLNMAGGNIRNIALNAAFLAAESGEAVGMAHVLRAAQMEAAKIERPLSDIETRGWL
ncbi:ATP-binding protein [Paraburkholderia sp. SIMBA_049]